MIDIMQFRYQESVRAYSTLTFANWSSINSSFGPQHIGGKSLPTINIIESYRALHLNINSLETVIRPLFFQVIANDDFYHLGQYMILVMLVVGKILVCELFPDRFKLIR